MTKSPDAPVTAALASLVDSIISAYHTTRLKDVTASQHVLAHANVQQGFKHLTALLIAAHQPAQQGSAAQRAEQQSASDAEKLRGKAAAAQLAAIRALMNSFAIPDEQKLTLVLDYLDLPATHIPRSQRK
jgi:hypothetical protein